MIERIQEEYRRGGFAGVFTAVVRFGYWQLRIRTIRSVIGFRLFGPVTASSIVGPEVEFVATNPREYGAYTDFVHEQDIIRDVAAELKADDVFYDVGANLGIYTCLMASLLEEGTVIGFEPREGFVERIHENARRNNLDVQVVPCALIDEAESSASAAFEDFETCTGDALIGDGTIVPPNVMKIDVEGAEGIVLAGLQQTLRDGHCRTIYIELHPDRIERFDWTTDAVEAMLIDLGYAITVLEHRPPEYFIKATR